MWGRLRETPRGVRETRLALSRLEASRMKMGPQGTVALPWVVTQCPAIRDALDSYSLIVTEDRFWESNRPWILRRSGRPSGDCRRSRDCCEGAAVTFEIPAGRERMSLMARLRSRSDAKKSIRGPGLPGCACKLRAATKRTAP
jgi:hypothetical protein